MTSNGHTFIWLVIRNRRGHSAACAPAICLKTTHSCAVYCKTFVFRCRKLKKKSRINDRSTEFCFEFCCCCCCCCEVLMLIPACWTICLNQLAETEPQKVTNSGLFGWLNPSYVAFGAVSVISKGLLLRIPASQQRETGGGPQNHHHHFPERALKANTSRRYFSAGTSGH